MVPLRLCLCQFDIFWENASANREHLTKLFSEIPINAVDVIILPEMFSTGFSMSSQTLAEEMEGPTMQWMHEQADKFNTAIVGSMIIQEFGKYYNRLVWIEPYASSSKHYDKKHLFTLAGEQNHYKPGQLKLQLEWKGWNMSFFVCYDLRFPVWSRNTQDVDLMIYVANFPSKRQQAWNSLLPARAIENQCYVAGVNRVGNDGNGIAHRGDSSVYDFEGNQILDLGHNEKLAFINLDGNALQVYKRAYPFLMDRDIFQIV